MKKTLMLIGAMALSFVALTAAAQDTGTPQEVHDKCLEASATLEQLGPEALPACQPLTTQRVSSSGKTLMSLW